MKNFVNDFVASLKRLNKKTLLLVLAVFLLGAAAAFWMRFTLVQKDDVHYHANFAVYINGQREPFDNFMFYEEVSACTGDYVNNPPTRVHMHDQVNHVVHVHDRAATWGHFLANLGYALGNKIIVKPDGRVYVDGQSGELRFFLNGRFEASMANRVIGNEDVLLIDFSNDSEAQLKSRFEAIVRDAAEYNTRLDPSSCSGGKPESFKERFKRTLGLDTNT